MKLVVRVSVMALCVLVAYALPSLSDVNAEAEKVLLQVRLSQLQRAAVAAAVVSPPSVSSLQDSCTTKFTEEVTKINNKTVNDTQKCYTSAEGALEEFDDTVLNKTVVEVNALSKNLQMLLANCSAKTTNIDILICNLESIDKAMANLNSISSLSQVGVSSSSDVEVSVEFQAKMCVHQTLVNSKINSSIATNNLQACLSNTTVVSGKSVSKYALKSKGYFLN